MGKGRRLALPSVPVQVAPAPLMDVSRAELICVPGLPGSGSVVLRLLFPPSDRFVPPGHARDRSPVAYEHIALHVLPTPLGTIVTWAGSISVGSNGGPGRDSCLVERSRCNPPCLIEDLYNACASYSYCAASVEEARALYRLLPMPTLSRLWLGVPRAIGSGPYTAEPRALVYLPLVDDLALVQGEGGECVAFAGRCATMHPNGEACWAEVFLGSATGSAAVSSVPRLLANLQEQSLRTLYDSGQLPLNIGQAERRDQHQLRYDGSCLSLAGPDAAHQGTPLWDVRTRRCLLCNDVPPELDTWTSRWRLLPRTGGPCMHHELAAFVARLRLKEPDPI